LVGLPPIVVLILLLSGNTYVGLAMLALALLVDGACFAIVKGTSGKAMHLLGAPNRQITYLLIFIILTVLPTVVFALGINLTESLSSPFLKIELLSGKTFEDGVITAVGLVIVLAQALMCGLTFLIPREALGLSYLLFNRDK
jgi:hypothetical protein